MCGWVAFQEAQPLLTSVRVYVYYIKTRSRSGLGHCENDSMPALFFSVGDYVVWGDGVCRGCAVGLRSRRPSGQPLLTSV